MKDAFNPITTIIIVSLIVIVGLIFDQSPPLPSNCHQTSSVDAGGSEIECD